MTVRQDEEIVIRSEIKNKYIDIAPIIYLDLIKFLYLKFTTIYCKYNQVRFYL